MLPETMQMNFFGEGLQEISSMRIFYATLVGLVVGAGISSVTEYYGIRKNNLKNCTTIIYWCRNKRNCRFSNWV
jgi:K(+)-stimulated pyrophosphate-energized sodium pump